MATESPPRLTLQNSGAVQRQLQGNLLHSLIVPEYPELADKITGMLLELDSEEVGELLAHRSLREEKIDEAIEVLREAGDARVPPRGATAAKGSRRPQLDVDVSAAVQAMPASSGVTPSLAVMRMSPRVSSNPFSSTNILHLGSEQAQGGPAAAPMPPPARQPKKSKRRSRGSPEPIALPAAEEPEGLREVKSPRRTPSATSAA